MICELVGLPAVGKSSVFAAMGDADGWKSSVRTPSIPPSRRAEVYFERRDSEFLQRARAILRKLAVARSSEPDDSMSESRAFEVAWREFIGRAAVTMYGGQFHGVDLLEEGTIHQSWRLHQLASSAGVSAGELDLLWDCTPMPAFAIQLESTRAERAVRLSGRSHYGPVNMPLVGSATPGPLWDAAEARYSRVLGRARARGVRVISVSSGSPRSEREVADAVREVLSEIVQLPSCRLA